ncbi:MAG: RBBP9/YdeN family alpha/beta hydrolase [Sphingobacteriales bacterium]|jgi:predicted alpha/beta hydrolase family esterase
MTNYLIIPGLGNSGPEHWQTFFENSGSHFYRVEQREWDSPDCEDWVKAIDQHIRKFDPITVVLIGHSLGCTTIAHWAARNKTLIKGALLVAPSDIEQPVYTFPATGFAPIPLLTLPFPSIVVASEDDPWVSLERAGFFAERWGSRFQNIGKAGHINLAAGFGPWPQGLELLQQL